MEPDLATAQPLPPVEGLEALEDRLLRRLAERLRALGLHAARPPEVEEEAPRQLDAVRQPLIQRQLERRADPASRLALVLQYGGAVTRRELSLDLGTDLASGLLAAGALAEDGGRVAARLRLAPLGGLLFFSDPPGAGPQAVMGTGAATAELVGLLPAGAGAVLDASCGAGTLALLAAARGARRAVGIDPSARAIALARINARLNGLAVETRQGDLLEPVAGERFDLVVSRPPCAPRPPGAALRVHGGPRGDEVALRLAAAFPQALAEGGRALLLFDSPRTGEALGRRLREAIGPAPVNLAVLVAPGATLDSTAAACASLEDGALGSRYREAAVRYRDHLDRLGATGFTRALAVLRRSGVAGGRHDVESPVAGLSRLDAAALDLWLAGLDLLAAPDEVLRGARLRPAPGARLLQERDFAGGEVRRWLRFPPGGIPVDREIAEGGEVLLDALATAPSLSAAEALFAEASGKLADQVRRTVMDFAREGLSSGTLVPASAPSRSVPIPP